jgi:hypothetical protein
MSPTRRWLVTALIVWIFSWGCLGALFYFNDDRAAYVLDREGE